MATVTISVEADNPEDFAQQVRAWAGPPPEAVVAPEPDTGIDPDVLRTFLQSLTGDRVRRLLVEIAKATQRGELLDNSPKLQRAYGVKGGIGFAGVIGSGINRRAKKALGRGLVESEWQGDHSAWRVPGEAVPVILEEYGDDEA